MESFISFMGIIIDFMKQPFTIYGFEFSFWGIFMFVILGSIVMGFIGGLFSD